ncbi:MAG: hypothetical protein J4G10_02720 [Alphaproteobacteria bacterium]|nr:hypothetical protein [Alphaproteobacteria bacterium]
MDSIPLWVAMLAALGAVALVLLTCRILHLNRRLALLTSAIESHSELTLRMQLRDANIPIVWWDKTVEPWPDEGKRHRNRSELTHVVLGVPERLRWGTTMRRYQGLLAIGLLGTAAAAVWLFGLAPGVFELAAAWKREILFAALVLFGLLSFYALVQCFRKRLELERLRPAVPPERPSEGR